MVVDPCDPNSGWGIFGRAGIADRETNPVEYFLSAGVGGNSRIFGRENDTFGMGWYYSETSRQIAPFLSALLGNVGDGQGGEVFYNFQVRKRLSITADSQLLLPSRQDVNNAYVTGLRVNLAF